ncbi:hypothetical protein CXK86_23040 [Paenibacillus sp. BGI2013]|uniref:hypothetical protein n=1 Tax=Paenibacillus TaxID=44249 RepID=UPI0003E26412|nr:MULTISPECIES: hypothetical protein [Paenibacillus]ETT40682.1 hypothetical protein C161_01915 [Paenibacillus sp. FSL R5-192]PKQ88996.1 hypothetical protein CXK86_23040 [Paenibacillus sp. BGI2013]
MEKTRVIPLNQRVEYPIIEENRRILESGKRETGTERALIHNPSVTNEVVKSQQNIWTSRVLRNGARNQPWFDKLQDYRNQV